MKLKIAVVFLVVLSARAEPAFVGLMIDHLRGANFAVIPTGRSTARWVKLGDTVDGYAIAEYQAENEVLLLKNGEQVLRLKLKASKVANAGAFRWTIGYTELNDAKMKLQDAQDKLGYLIDLSAGKIRDLPPASHDVPEKK